MSAREALEHAARRAELHGDPIADVLLALAATMDALEDRGDVERLARAAALGANEQVVALIRAHDRRACWVRMAVVVLVAVVFAAGGFVVGRAGWF